MTLHATAFPNTGSFSHNRDALHMRVFDDEREVRDAILYTASFTPRLAINVQLVGWLQDLGFLADWSAVREVAGGYRIEPVTKLR